MLPICDNIPARRFPLAMWSLVALHSVIFLLEQTLTPSQLEKLFFLCGVLPARTVQLTHAFDWKMLLSDGLTFITSIFLHGGWLHFLGNMWVLYLFGDNVEDRMGPIRFLLFYLICGVCAGWTHVLFYPTSQVPTIGASGAIAGVLGAYVLLYPHASVLTLIPVFIFPWFVELPAVVFIGLWYLTQVFAGVLALADEVAYSGVAWWAHVGGFLAGLILAPLFVRRPHRPRYADEYRPW